MKKNRYLLIAFLILALVQLWTPFQMILNREKVLSSGTEYKFRTAPIDPNDPFRGKYVRLSFQDDMATVDSANGFERGEKVFVTLRTDSAGFAKIKTLSKKAPTNQNQYLTARIRYYSSTTNHKVTIDFPFDRYYMEESKAPKAETRYREAQRDTTLNAHALVNVLNGQSVLKDVVIDGVSIENYVEQKEASRSQ